MSAGERVDTRRRLAVAIAASVVLHLSLVLWWRGTGSGGGGSPGSGSDRAGGSAGIASGSVIEVDIAVDADVPAGTRVPVDEDLVTLTHDETAPQRAEANESMHANAASASDSASGLAGRASGSADQGGRGGGVGAGSGGAHGAGDGLFDGVGARLGGAGDGGGGGGAVPPRPVEITWPDTRRLAHCVGLRIDVRIRVDAQGRVERVEPASPGVASECVRAALETAKQIKFTPGTVAGKPATMWTQVTIDFEKEK